MKACATQENIVEKFPVGNLFLPIPDTDFCAFLDEIDELVKMAPEIIEAIEADLKIYAQKKKKLRLEDKKFFESQTGNFPKLDIKERNLLARELKMAVGRPRMSAYSVYVFLIAIKSLNMLMTGYLRVNHCLRQKKC